MKPPADSDRFPRAFVCAIIGVFAALCAVYNVTFPPFEGGDEVAHYLMSDWYASRGTMPDLRNPPSHEAMQPPLYHALIALAIAPIDRTDFERAYERNPDNGLGFHIATRPTPETTRVPPEGSVLALRIARYATGLFGAVAIALTASTAWLVFRRRDITVLAAGLLAFNPKVLHMSSTMTNDFAVAACAGLAIWLAVRVSRGRRSPDWPLLAALGAACGLATLTKFSGLATLAPAGIALIWRATESRTTRKAALGSLLRMCAWTAAGFIAITGWYFAHNINAYGDPLAWEQVRHIAFFAARETPLTASEILAQWPTLLATAWGSFGYGARLQFDVERALVVFSFASGLGFLVGLARRQVPKRVALLAISIIAVSMAYISWTRSYGGTETSRLMSPAALPATILCATGALAWFPARARNAAGILATLLVLAVGASTPWTTLIPAYRPPDALAPAAVARLPAAGRVLYAQGIELMKAELEQSRISPGNSLRVRLLWRATRPMDRAYVRVVEAIDLDGRTRGRDDQPPLGARLSTRFWEVGAVYEETVEVALEPGPADMPSVVQVYVGWHEHSPPYELVRVAGSDAVSAQVGAFRIRSATSPGRATAPPIAVFGALAQLEEADVTTDDARFVFRAAGEPNINLTIFVHGYDASGALISQEDFPFNPSAPLWLAGDRISVTQRVKGLGGATRVGMGVYDPATNERLPAIGPDGTRLANDIAIVR